MPMGTAAEGRVEGKSTDYGLVKGGGGELHVAVGRVDYVATGRRLKQRTELVGESSETVVRLLHGGAVVDKDQGGRRMMLLR